jgi:amino acid permease
MEEGGIGLGAGFVFTINVVIGAGFLGLPYGFQEAGILLSLFYLLGSSLINTYLGLMFLEVMHKVQYIKLCREEGQPIELNIRNFITPKKIINIPYLESKEKPESRIDVSRAMLLIFGKKFGIAYLIMLTLCFEGFMIAYASIFSISFSSNIPLGSLGTCNVYEDPDCMSNYRIYLCIYSVTVVFLTLKGLKEQMLFQIIMCCMRFVIMSLVIFCSLSLIINKISVDDGSPVDSRSPVLFDFNKTTVVLPIILFALMFQLQLPSISEMIANKEKNLWRLISIVSLVSLIWYGALGAVVPFAVDQVEEQVTLNFRNYSAGYSQSERPFWTYIIDYVIVLFPALDVVSSFPLVSITLSDNWKTMIYGEQEISAKKTLLIRFITAILPLIIAFVVYDLVFYS